jgi:anti-sigma regulatory factor (Ser/Thr protein kinase)
VPERVAPSVTRPEPGKLSLPTADGGEAQALQWLEEGTTVWDTTGPLVPLVLSETERRFRFRSMPQAVGAARRALHQWETHFEPELFYDLSLCVSELVTKSVQHVDSSTGDEIELAVSRGDRLVRAEVMEPWPDVAVTQPSAMRSGDWGMFIVDRVADRWGVDRGVGTLLWCEIDLCGDGRSRGGLVAGRRHLYRPL